MTRTGTFAALLAVAVLSGPPALGATPHGPASHVVLVKMVDKGGGKWAFEPADLSAQPGDTVRFLQTDVVPHNVQFKNVPSGADLGVATMGPFLLRKGDHYDLVVDARFVSGTYAFVCTPHEMFGMKGTLEVGAGAGTDAARPQPSSRTPSGGVR